MQARRATLENTMAPRGRAPCSRTTASWGRAPWKRVRSWIFFIPGLFCVKLREKGHFCLFLLLEHGRPVCALTIYPPCNQITYFYCYSWNQVPTFMFFSFIFHGLFASMWWNTEDIILNDTVILLWIGWCGRYANKWIYFCYPIFVLIF
jgi:hypothetical protein